MSVSIMHTPQPHPIKSLFKYLGGIFSPLLKKLNRQIDTIESPYRLSRRKFIPNAPVTPAIVNGKLNPFAPHDLDVSLCLKHINDAQAITAKNHLDLQDTIMKRRARQFCL